MKRNSRLLYYVLCISLLSSFLVGGFSYWLLRQHIIGEARDRNTLLLDFVNASATYFEHSQKRLINELLKNNDGFYPELTNGFMLLREQSERLGKRNKGYSLHLASLNPLNSANWADNEETRIINAFQNNQQLKIQEGLVRKNNDVLFYTATPIRITGNSCLNCHGAPDNAPRAQIVLYGRDSGYNWQENTTIAAAIAYASVENVISEARKNALKIFAVSLACSLLSFTAIFLFFDRD
jgi:hypothetical protein